jgi:hypothetical protein
MSASQGTIILAPPTPQNPIFNRKTVTETDFQTTPHFSRGGPAHAAIGTVWLLFDFALPGIVTIVGFFAYAAVMSKFGHLLHPAIVLSAIALVVGVVFWNRLKHAAHMLKRNNDIASLPFAPDERYRVRIICWPDEVEDLETISTDSFEPERFKAILPDAKYLDLTRPAQRVSSIFGMPIGYLNLLVVAPPLVSLIAAAIFTAIAAYLFRMPTYTRISPGTLEIIRYKFGGTRPWHRQTFRLDGPVTISTKGLGRIDWKDEAGKKRSLPLGFVIGRREALRAAIAAALAEDNTPEPDSL